MNIQLTIVITFFFLTQGFGQYIASDRIDESQLWPWKPKPNLNFKAFTTSEIPNGNPIWYYFLVATSFTDN